MKTLPRITLRRHPVRGQALLETALLFSILLLLLAGTTDVGSLLSDHLNVVYAARQGVRTASVLGKDPASDCITINAVRATVADESSITLVDIIIYDAGASGQPLATAGGTMLEDTYTGATTCTVANDTPTYTPAPAASTQQWLPSARNNQPFYEDSVGVQIDYTVTTQFQLFGPSPLALSDRAIMPLEIIGVPTPAPTTTVGT